MKNLTKLFFAVAALAAAFACTTDATEQLGVELGKDRIVINLSLEESRTQLGEKVEGVYPHLWSEGDAIAVNGVASTALTAEQAGSAVAGFEVSASAPYSITYPVAPAGQVLFAEKQAHTSNTTFGSGVATMYAYSEDGIGVQLNHLTGVLKIGVTGSAKLALAQISTADRAAIAGAFDFNFVDGKATPSASSKEVIEYSFGEGVALSNAPTYLHVAVPAGKYDELYLTLYDTEGGVMYATVKADDEKPLTAGHIREFKNNIAYAANESLYIIKDAATLKAFAAAAPTLEKDVLFVADVDMTGEAWTPIEGYAKTVRGNGYAIKGLTAPLFGTTSASFKGLHLRGVDINETANPNVGALARRIVATDAVKPTVEHCSASGTILVNCTEAITIENTFTSFAIGGLVGCVNGVDFDCCVNDIDIDVDSVIATSNTTVIYPSIAGVVALIDAHKRTDNEVVLSNLSNCENRGDVYVVMPRLGGTTEYENVVVSYVAGVAARFKSTNDACSVSNIVNRGNITLSGYHGQGLYDSNDADAVNYKDIDSCLAGVVGHLEITNGTNLSNYGTVSYTSGASRFHYIGGVAGMCGKSAVLSNLNNYGKVEIPNGDTKMVSLHCGGVIAHTTAGSKLSDSNNNGEVSIKCKTVGGGSHRYFRVGGISAFADGSIDNCHNLVGGKVVCDTSISKSGNWRDVCIAGAIAYKESDPVKDSSNSAHIFAKITMAGGANDDSKRVTVGGVVGISAQPCNNITNNGQVEVWGTHHKLYVGGVIGDMNYTANKNVGGYHLNARVVVRGTTTVAHNAYIGGVVAYAKGVMTDLTVGEKGGVSIGDSKSAATFSKPAFIGGCIGYAENTANSFISSATNRGAVNVSGNATDVYYIGGIAGQALMPINTADNYGTVTVANLVEGGKRYIAGICPYLYAGGSNLTNHESADINVTILNGSNTYISGICGYVNANGTDLLNKGDITVNGSISALTLISGGYSHSQLSNTTITRVGNEGNIIINAECGGDTRIAGLQGDSNMIQRWVDCYNTGNITFSAKAKATKALRIGGLMAYTRNANMVQTLSNCYNTGNITIEKGATISCVEYIGGLIGQATHTSPVVEDNIFNSGNIVVNNEGNTANNVYVGGVVGNTAVMISNADSYCSLESDVYTANIGWVTGSARVNGSVVAASCKIGGKTMGIDEKDETVKEIVIDGYNFKDYIYGSRNSTDWTGTSNYDGCSFLSEKPTPKTTTTEQ